MGGLKGRITADYSHQPGKPVPFFTAEYAEDSDCEDSHVKCISFS